MTLDPTTDFRPTDPTEKPISSSDSFDSFVILSSFWVVFLALTVVLAAVLCREGKPEAIFLPLPFLGIIGIAIMSEYSFQKSLRNVWMSGRGLRVSDQHGEIFVPHRAIASIAQKWHSRTLYITIELREETAFGRRLTFLPAQFSIWNDFRTSFGGTHAVVAELRERVADAQASLGKKSLGPRGVPARSIMADAELDGPL